MELKCPLCCDKSFDSSSDLKSHVLDILENLVCPICDENFKKAIDFVQHLGRDCGNLKDDSIELTDEKSEHNDENTVDIENSILAKALLEGSESCKKELQLEEESQYYCQSCDLDFNDINSHLNKFHEGQEIVLEEEETQTIDDLPTDDQSQIVLVINPADPLDDEAPPLLQDLPLAPPTAKKVKKVTENIKDKAGRSYTRKFVKIDKFWLEDDKNEPEAFVLTSKSEEEEVEEDKNAAELISCQNCDMYFPMSEISNHDCDEKSKIQHCEVCNTTFPTFKSLRLHRRMHEPIRARQVEAPANYDEGEEPVRQMFICKICHKTYDKEYEKVHMNSHDCNNGFNCEVCNRKFHTKSNLEMHIKAHSNNKKFACSYCKKSFVAFDSLNDHLLNQCQKREYACQYCGRRFARPHEKVKHERIHTGEKPHVCDICGKAFRVSYCLTLHMRTHSGSRPYQCSHCGKRFKSHSVYNHHLMTHSEVRAYKCPYCPKAFKTSVQLAGHKNSHIKPFTCTECNRPFASLYAVRAHMDTHKRDNTLKYECWICGALYSRAFALRDHLKYQHQQVDEEKKRPELMEVDEELEAANSILVNEEDIILGLEGADIEIIENEAEEISIGVGT